MPLFSPVGPEREIARRDFVGWCACALAAAAVGGCASITTRSVTATDGRLQLALVQYPELLEPGGFLKIHPEGQNETVYVLALGDGTFTALSPICTHLGCTVEIEGSRLVCPCHGSTYDRSGTVLKGPAPRALSRMRTHVSSDGVLTIDLANRT